MVDEILQDKNSNVLWKLHMGEARITTFFIKYFQNVERFYKNVIFVSKIML